MTDQAGDLIAGRYELKRCLARGGMGSVWVAEHLQLGSEVAVKLLRPDHRPEGDRIERFRREAQEAGRLKSPHIVRVQDFGLEDGVPFIVMELLLGEDLGRRLDRQGHLPAETALAFLEHAARGLTVAHRAGIVHRDIKPANLFIERQAGRELLKVVDFGVAKRTSETSDLTTGGIVWGSPAYMSPEQARGEPVDERTDVWALAGVFYRMLTGRAPFSGKSEHDVIVKLCTETVRPASELNPDLPRSIDDFFRHALARNPDQRIGTVAELATQAALALGLPAEVNAEEDSPGQPDPADNPSGRNTETVPLAAPLSASAAPPAAPGARRQPRVPAAGLAAAASAALLLVLVLVLLLLVLPSSRVPQTGAPSPERFRAKPALNAPASHPGAADTAPPRPVALPPSPPIKPPLDPRETHTPANNRSPTPRAAIPAPAPRGSAERSAARTGSLAGDSSRRAPTPTRPPSETDPIFGLPVDAAPERTPE